MRPKSPVAGRLSTAKSVGLAEATCRLRPSLAQFLRLYCADDKANLHIYSALQKAPDCQNARELQGPSLKVYYESALIKTAALPKDKRATRDRVRGGREARCPRPGDLTEMPSLPVKKELSPQGQQDGSGGKGACHTSPMT